jgi:hypothetical protein
MALLLAAAVPVTTRAEPVAAPWATITAVADDVSQRPIGSEEPALVGQPLVLTLRVDDPVARELSAQVEWEPGRLSPRVAFDPTSQTADFRTIYTLPGTFEILPRPADADQAPAGSRPYRLAVESRADSIKRLQAWLDTRLRNADYGTGAAPQLQAANRLLGTAGEQLAADDEAGFMNSLVYATEQLASVEDPSAPTRLPYYRRLALLAWVTARQRIDRNGEFDDESAEQAHLRLAEEWLKAGEGILRRGNTVDAIGPFELALFEALRVN